MTDDFGSNIGSVVGEEVVNKLMGSIGAETSISIEGEDLIMDNFIGGQEQELEQGMVQDVKRHNLDLGIKRVADVQVGEEALAEELVFDIVRGAITQIFCGVDGGSTQTRVASILPEELDEDEDSLTTVIQRYSIIPSTYCEVGDSRDIKSNSSLVWDAMDTTISPVGPIDGRKLNTSVRIVRGGKKEQVNIPEVKMDTANQKTSSTTFYINIIDALGYAFVHKFKDKCPESITVFLGVALPPDDLNTRNLENFKKSLKGTYSWTLQGKTILIDIVSVTSISEPEAAIQGMLTLDNSEPPEYVLHVEGGGRSTGVAVLKNGNTLNPTQKTFMYGGTQLIEKLNEAYINDNGGSPIKARLWEQALNTGLLKSGNSYKDVQELVLKVKRQFASQIADDIWRQVFSQQDDVTPQDINMVTIGGRLFSRGNLEFSVGDYLSTELKKRLPDTKCLLVTENFIPFGLLMTTLIEHMQGEE